MNQQPMMYIEQPKLQAQYAPMQEEFRSENQLKSISKAEKQEPVTEHVQSPNTSSSSHDSSKNAAQKFKQMTKEEKIDYVLTPSKIIPRMLCKLSINNTYYRGKILMKEKDQIVFQENHSAKRHVFDLEEINDIQLIGF